VLDKLLGKYPVEVMEIDLPFKSNDGIVSYTGVNLNPSLKKARRILPWEVNSEGFFLIKLKKNGKTTPPDQIVSRKQEIRFLNPESKELVHKLDKLSAIFGITAETFSKYQYYFKKNDIYFAVKEWQDVNPGMFERIGTKLGTLDRNNEIVLHTNAAQILSDSISSSIYYLENQNELKIYLEGGSIKKDIGKYGQYVIKYNELLLGTAVISKDGIKSRFPRSKRTQEIQKEF
jgi:16S rRNA (cytosine1407-C5)-methyltransferase